MPPKLPGIDYEPPMGDKPHSRGETTSPGARENADHVSAHNTTKPEPRAKPDFGKLGGRGKPDH